MARIFNNCLDCAKEMDRELKVCGLSVPVKHYQNVMLEKEDQMTKELIGVSFIISKPLSKRREMIEFLFPDEVEKIEKYCEQEIKDRVSGKALNPGNSYKIRFDLWQKFMAKGIKEEKFDYTYSERISNYKQLQAVIGSLREDVHSRRAMLMIWDPSKDSNRMEGASTRIPCSISYQFLIRNDRLFCVYYIRSNDYYAHWAIDIWLAGALMEYVRKQLLDTYPNLKLGSLHYFCGSFHAYNHDLKKRNVVF